jgi:hypothetical protein
MRRNGIQRSNIDGAVAIFVRVYRHFAKGVFSHSEPLSDCVFLHFSDGCPDSKSSICY